MPFTIKKVSRIDTYCTILVSVNGTPIYTRTGAETFPVNHNQTMKKGGKFSRCFEKAYDFNSSII